MRRERIFGGHLKVAVLITDGLDQTGGIGVARFEQETGFTAFLDSLAGV